MFGECHTEDEKVKMVDDLLDVKLLPATNIEGVHFNTQRLRERYLIINCSFILKLASFMIIFLYGDGGRLCYLKIPFQPSCPKVARMKIFHTYVHKVIPSMFQ